MKLAMMKIGAFLVVSVLGASVLGGCVVRERAYVRRPVVRERVYVY